MDVLGVVIIFAPLILILWVANLALRSQSRGDVQNGSLLALLAYLGVALLYGALMLSGALLGLIGLLMGSSGAQAPLDALRAAGLEPASIANIGLGLALPSLLGMLLLLPPVRRICARILPIDAHSPVDAVALSFTALVLLNLLLTLGIGLGNLQRLMEAGTATAGYNPIPGLWVQDILMFFMALVGVGWLSRANLGAALKRLALVLPTLRQASAGVGLGLLLVGLALVLEYGFKIAGIAPGDDVEKLTEQMLGPLFKSIVGILTLGLAAALGEESIFRGALLPKFGLIFTSLLFALLHSNYGVSTATLAVFLVGLVLGLVRLRANTTTAMIVHAVYNMTLGMITYLGLMQNF